MNKSAQSTMNMVVLALAFIFVFSSMFFYSDAETTIEPFIINGSVVYVDDENVTMKAYPHTITNSQYVNFNLTTKKWSGDIDIIFGFNSSGPMPKSAELYNPQEVSEQKSYTCGAPYWWNNTPNHFYCWNNISIPIYDEPNGTIIEYENSTILIFDHEYETANALLNTAYWTETHIVDYVSVVDVFIKENWEYGGMDTWYYTQGVPVVAGTEYSIKSYIDIPFNSSGKYWFCAKPSSQTLIEAYNAGTLYCLDPWWNSSWDYKKEIQIDGIGDDIPNNYQLKLEVDYVTDHMNSTFKDLRFTNSDENVSLDYWVEQNVSETNATVWVEVPIISNTTNTTVYMYYGNPTATSESNGANVFEEYFDKDSTSGWSISGMTVTTSGDYLRFYNDVWASIGSAKRFDLTLPTEYIMESQFKSISLSSVDSVQIQLLDGTTSDRKTWLFIPGKLSGDLQTEWKYAATYPNRYVGGAYIEGTEYIFKNYVNDSDSSTGSNYYLMNTSRSVLSSATGKAVGWGTPTDTDGLLIGDSTSSGELDYYAKWIIFRKYASTEPTYSFGAEETSNTAPTITANSTSPATIYTDTDTTANLTVTDPDDGDTLTAYIQFYVNDSAVGDVVSTGVTNNTNTLVATLGSGNYSSGDNITTEYWAGDGTVNTTKANMTDTVQSQFIITLNSPADEYNSSDNTTDFNFTVSGTDDSYSCELFLNDTGYSTNTTTLNNTETIITANSSVNDGYYDWNINCTAGITTNTSEIRQITIDTVTPNITIYSPTNTTYSSVTVDLNTSADEDIATWIYTLNGGNWIGFTPNTTFTAIEGNNNITIAAYDYANNVNTSSTIYFTVDSCSCPASGNWDIDCADNCALTSCNMNKNNFTIIGTGTITGFKNIYNYTKGHISGGCNVRA